MLLFDVTNIPYLVWLKGGTIFVLFSAIFCYFGVVGHTIPFLLQVMYQRNLTAYALLMKVGSCAYGGCKHEYCPQSHDVTSMEIYLEMSQNGTVMPSL